MSVLLINCNSLKIPLADSSVNCVVTSPPYYGLRDYGTARWEGGDPECDHLAPARGGRGKASKKQTTNTGTQAYQYSGVCAKCGAVRVDGQIGLEETPEAYVDRLVQVFREVWRALRDDGTVWVNLGDSYAGSGGVGNQRDDANKGNMPHFKNPNSYAITRSKRMERGAGRWGGGNLPATGNLKPKDLIGIPWMVAFALRADGWYLRSDIIWHKPNPMPESVTDRPTKAHEYIFLLSKSAKYYYDAEAILEPISKNTHLRISQDLANQIGSFRANGGANTNGPMKAVVRTPKQQPAGRGIKNNDSFDNALVLPVTERNKRTVWTVATQPYSGAHFATYPAKLIEPCIKAGCPAGGIVMDPFSGSGTTIMVARNLGRQGIGLDLSLNYIQECAVPRLQLGALKEFEQGRKAGGNYSDLPLFREDEL